MFVSDVAWIVGYLGAIVYVLLIFLFNQHRLFIRLELC